MSRFSKKKIPHQAQRTTNYEGGDAYIQNPKLELVSILLTSFVQDQFYRSADNANDRLVQVFESLEDKKFAAKAAIYARTEFGMRSISHVMAAEIVRAVKLANNGKNGWVANFISKVIHRPDDMIEIKAYYENKYGKKPAPNALKRGFAKAFEKFNSYQLAKYRAEGKSISLVDVVNYAHPKPTENNADALKKLIAGELKSFDTWESKLSEAGQKGSTAEEKEAAKAEAWADMIRSKKIGAFALLRNLRNIIETAPEVLGEALELLVDEKRIRKSLILPFRYATAYFEIGKLGVYQQVKSKTCNAIAKAMDIACQNVPRFDGKTLVVLDTSGSMTGTCRDSKAFGNSPAQIGAVLAGVLLKSNECDFMTFDSDARYVNYGAGTPAIHIALNVNFHGGSTIFSSIFKTARMGYDRIILLSDMQGWDQNSYYRPDEGLQGAFKSYKKKFSCDPFLYSIDLQGYGTMMFPESKVFCLAGFSEKIFDIMKLLETDKNAMISKIEEVEL